MIKVIFKVSDIELYGNKEKFHKDFGILAPGTIKGWRCKYEDPEDEVELTIDQVFEYGLLEKGI